MLTFPLLFLFGMKAVVLQGFLLPPSVLNPFNNNNKQVSPSVSGLVAAVAVVERDSSELPLYDNAFHLFDEALRESLYTELGIVKPNEVQNASLPIAMSGEDVFVVAQTGSGKTLTFLLPILSRINHTNTSSSPSGQPLPVAMVIGPTRELLAQHFITASKLAPPSVVERILFQTPQQLLDSSITANNNSKEFATIDIVAIDEVDAVLCGSEFNETTPETSIELLNSLPEEAQYILTTAHLTRSHTKVIHRLFPNIERIRQTCGSNSVLVPTLRQVFHYFSGTKVAKLVKLEDILQKSEAYATMIFCQDEKEVDAVHTFLESCTILNEAFLPAKLHGQLPANDRLEALSRFKNEDHACQLLVTHEIAARGLDCPAVQHVILFDTPTDVTAFVHRAGRTARAGKQGVVTCLIQAGGGGGAGSGSFGDSGGGSFGKHKNLHALLDAPKLSFATKDNDDELIET
mmetsp:Transcript_48732/g.54529  ORF Transcript_48732/g.54529 Transcript_48732/m.54529 type:complete len:461 (-) Transcript_48732:103-1485(-)